MNSIHDIGGMDNFGPVVVEKDEPVFHDDWERQVFSLLIALLPAGYFSVDEIRRATEMIPPVDYLQSQYYEKWLLSLETLLLEKDVLTKEEMQSGKSIRQEGGNKLPAVAKEMLQFAMTNPIPASLDLDIEAKYKAGDQVKAKNINPLHHTRLPRYIRGKSGTVERDHGVFLLPDTNAYGGPDKPQHVYTVRFSARDIWGDDAPAKDSICIDLFDDYMDPLNKN
jgi:nitrile hydratase subunit beta